MRIIAGKFRGTRLEAVNGSKTRPTTDKVKEAMFSMLMPYLDDGQALDLYAGTGGLGLEAVSRGMTHATLVDRQFQAIKVIEQNVQKTHAENQFTILKAPAQAALQKLTAQQIKFDMVFWIHHMLKKPLLMIWHIYMRMIYYKIMLLLSLKVTTLLIYQTQQNIFRLFNKSTMVLRS